MKRLTVFVMALFFALSAHGHTDDSLNKNGCHQGKRDVAYHCHEGVLKDRRFKSEEEAKKALIQARITAKNQGTSGSFDPPDVEPS